MFFFADFYILRSKKGNLCDCAGYVTICGLVRLLHMFLIVSICFMVLINAIILVMCAEDSYSKWF